MAQALRVTLPLAITCLCTGSTDGARLGWLQLWMMCATRGGDGWLWYIVATVVALFGGPVRWQALGVAGLATGAGIGIFLSLKRTTRRRRPCTPEPHCWSTLLPPDQFSFPSGHTITAFACAISLAFFYRDLLPGLMFCALSIAVSRIILGMHFLSDCGRGSGYRRHSRILRHRTVVLICRFS